MKKLVAFILCMALVIISHAWHALQRATPKTKAAAAPARL